MRITCMLCLVASACRAGFEAQVPGLEDIRGVMISAPGSLVIEDGHYEIAPRIDGDGYAVAWVEFPEGEAIPRIMFAVVDETPRRIVGPTVIELLQNGSGGLRLFAGSDGYLIAVRDPGTTLFLALDANGSVRARRRPGGTYYGIEMAATPTGYVGVHSGTGANTFSQIFTFAVDTLANPVAASAELDPSAATQVDPDVQWTGDSLAVVWTDMRSGSAQLRFARTAPGKPATSAAIYNSGEKQGLPHLVPDGTGGFLVAFDGYDSFPQKLMRISDAGASLWSAPGVIYDEARYHDTLDVAGSNDGRAGFAWITAERTLLTNVEFIALDGNVDAPPPIPTPSLLTDPFYSFCYPETARGRTGFAVAFAGEVEASLGLFVVVVPD